MTEWKQVIERMAKNDNEGEASSGGVSRLRRLSQYIIHSHSEQTTSDRMVLHDDDCDVGDSEISMSPGFPKFCCQRDSTYSSKETETPLPLTATEEDETDFESSRKALFDQDSDDPESPTEGADESREFLKDCNMPDLIPDADTEITPSVVTKNTGRLSHDICSSIRGLQMEIFTLLSLLPFSMTQTPLQDLLITKVCRNSLHYGTDICSDIDKHEHAKSIAESLANNYFIGCQLIYLGISSVTTLFLSPWMDKHGAKGYLIASCIGQMISSTITLLAANYIDLPAFVIVLASIPQATTGGAVVILTAAFSHSGKASSGVGRRKSFYKIQIVLSLAVATGQLAGGFAYRQYGMVTVMVISLVLQFCACLWCWALFSHDGYQGDVQSQSFKDRLRNLFREAEICDSFKACFKSRPGKKNTQLLCLFLSAVICIIPVFVQRSLDFYFCRMMYDWDVATFSVVSSVFRITDTVLYLPVLLLFTRVIPIGDPTMIIVGVLVFITQNLLHGFAYTKWMYYLQLFLFSFGEISIVGIRSHISNLVEPENIGKVFSVFSSMELSLPLVGDVIFAQIFNWSIDFMPGLVYVISAGLMTVPLVLIGYCSRLSSNPYSRLLSEESEADPPPGLNERV